MPAQARADIGSTWKNTNNKETDTMKRLSMMTLALSALMLGGCATGFGDAYGDTAFTAWDADRNGVLDGNEFGIGFENDDRFFDDWDMNDDGLLSDNEFGMAANEWGIDNDFGTWDVDRDGFLTDDEFGEGSFGLWDDDDDGFLTDDEFGVGFDMFG